MLVCAQYVVVGVGYAAVRIAEALGGPAFYTVSSKDETKVLSSEFGIDPKFIALNAAAALASASARLKTSDLESFNIVFNTMTL